jgi:hypothetical protein
MTRLALFCVGFIDELYNSLLIAMSTGFTARLALFLGREYDHRSPLMDFLIDTSEAED